MANSTNPGLDVDGAVQAEVFVLWLDDATPRLTGPCGAEPWYLEIGAQQDPLDVVAAATRRVVGEPVVVHSTSWRTDRGGVVLSFVAVIDAAVVRSLAAIPVERRDLARSGATTAPESIAYQQVLEHGLRHLAWLVQDDELVAERLSGGWSAVLAGYLPEPFRNLH
ncbi:MAG: hypothetical protein WC005_10110 [Candidatus Nanopelagicales bacterium]